MRKGGGAFLNINLIFDRILFTKSSLYANN